MTSHAPLSPQTMEHLAFIRLVYQQGIDQSQLPEPLNVTSVLTLHDATELLLALAAEHLGAGQPREFMKYWTELDPAKLSGGVKLSGRQGMNRLNSLRVALKHHGTLPGSAAVRLACSDTGAFFEDTVLSVFGIAFADIDMAEVVPQPGIRDKVKAASARAESGNLAEAIALLGKAYVELFDDDGPLGEVVGFGHTIRSDLSDGEIAQILWRPADPRSGNRRPAGGAHSLAIQIGHVTRAIQEIQQGLRVLALGIDYRQFFRFQQVTMFMDFMDDSDERPSAHRIAPTKDEFDYCRQFIITVALRMAELDAYAADPSWWAAL